MSCGFAPSVSLDLECVHSLGHCAYYGVCVRQGSNLRLAICIANNADDGRPCCINVKS